MIQLALAGTIGYDITVIGTVNGESSNMTKAETKDCELSCSFQLPQFELPENFTLTEYIISNVTGQPNKIAFNSTGELQSAQADDTIEIEYEAPRKELSIARVVTKTLNQGQNNIVVQLDNTGNIDLPDITVQISGDGVKTTDKQPVSVAKGKSEFATVIVSVTSQGTVDLVIKAYEKDAMLAQGIDTITVNAIPEDQKPEETKPTIIDADYAQQKTNELWKQLEEYEKTYLTKKSEGYNMPDLTSTISEAKSEIKKLQLESTDITEASFNRRTEVINNILEEISIKLGLAAPKKLGEKLKDNIGIIATSLGVLVSSLTAYGLLKTHVGARKP